MKYRFLVLIAAFKVLLICAWLFTGWDGFKASTVHAQTPASSAAEPKKPSDAPVKPSDNTAQAQTVKNTPERTDEKEKGLLAAINRRQKELDAREEELRAKEERYNAIKADIETRITELKKLNDRIDASIKKIDGVNDEKTKRVVKIYEAMSPEEAAPRIEKLDEQMAVLIISSMSEKKAAKVLALVDVGKSVKISQSLKIKEN